MMQERFRPRLRFVRGFLRQNRERFGRYKRRQKKLRTNLVFRADAALAKSEIYEALEERGKVCHSDSREQELKRDIVEPMS